MSHRIKSLHILNLPTFFLQLFTKYRDKIDLIIFSFVLQKSILTLFVPQKEFPPSFFHEARRK